LLLNTTLRVPVVAVDTETTGLERPGAPGGRQIWEFGAIRRDPDGATQVYHAFVDAAELRIGAGDPDDRREALEIGGFWDRHPQINRSAKGRVMREKELADLVMEVFAPDPETGARPYLLGCTPSFEDLGLADLLIRHGLIASEPPWHHNLVDAKIAAATRFRLPPPWRTETVTRLAGLDPAEYTAHQALEDARWALDLYLAALAPAWRIWVNRLRVHLAREWGWKWDR